MSIEGKILDAFPGPEHRSLRVALYSIAWAFEAVEGDDELAGRLMLRVLHGAPRVAGFDVDVLKGLSEELRDHFLKAAALLDDAALRIGASSRGV